MVVIAPFLVMAGLWLALTHGPAALVAMLRKMNARTGFAHAAQVIGAVIMVAGGLTTPVRTVAVTVTVALLGKALWRRNDAAVVGAVLGYAGASASSFTGLGCLLVGGAVLAAGVLAERRMRLAGPVRVAVRFVQEQRRALRGVTPVLPSLPRRRRARALAPGSTEVLITEVAEEAAAEPTEDEAAPTEAAPTEAEATEAEAPEAEATEAEATEAEAVAAPSARSAKRAPRRKAGRPEDEAVLAQLRARRDAGASPSTPCCDSDTEAPTSGRPDASHSADTERDDLSSAEIDEAFRALKEMFERS